MGYRSMLDSVPVKHFTLRVVRTVVLGLGGVTGRLAPPGTAQLLIYAGVPVTVQKP
jgi:hypothetical protein